MQIKKLLIIIGLAVAQQAAGQPIDNIGQTIQIHTQLSDFKGKPSWLLIIRDIDHNQNIPYLYDFTGNNNYWAVLTYGKNYLITASEMSFSPSGRKIKNFCGLESMGQIQRGVSMSIYISGKLTPNPDTTICNITKFTDPNFSIATPDNS